MTLLDEIGAATRVTILGLRYRLAMSVSTILGIALVVLVLLGFLAMADGFSRTLRSTGADDIAVVLSRGARGEAGSGIAAEDFRLIETNPLLAGAGSAARISGESYQVVQGDLVGGGVAGITLRGMSAAGPSLRPQVKLISGRLFRPGTNEIVVGSQVSRLFRGLTLGAEVRLGSARWRVVGLFDGGDGLYGSEIWTDVRILQGIFDKGTQMQSIRIALPAGLSFDALKRSLETDPRFHVVIATERQFFTSQSRGMVSLIESFGWPIAIVMAFGALTGALNTMYSSVHARTREIATLRAIGFGRVSAFVATMFEAVCLALAGGLLGLALGFALIDDFSASTLGRNMAQVMFKLHISPTVALQALVLAMAVGLVGGALPALRAARQPILSGLGATS